MPRRAAGLTAAKVRTAGPGRYGDGIGLYLLVRAPDSKFWIYRYVRDGRMHELGLGTATGKGAITLTKARDDARELYDLRRAGRDPLTQRRAAKSAGKEAAQAAEARGKTFAQAAALYVAAHESGWRSPIHHRQWMASLRDHVLPHIGDLPVADIGTEHVTSVLQPIWVSKTETAARVRGRVESVLDFAKTRGWRNGDNPARWRGHLQNLLPPRSKVATIVHHKALDWREIGSFMASLAEHDGVDARALKFTILTAARTSESLGATWSEIDLQNAIWIVPASRMKAQKEHRVPLSDAALAVLQVMALLRDDRAGGWVFPGKFSATGGLFKQGLADLLRRMGRRDITTHGFRSCFADWCAETGQATDIREAALAHALGSKVQAAYQRGDLLERRRKLMADWAAWCGA